MGKRGKGAVHGFRHGFDRVGRERRVREVFHASNYVHSDGLIAQALQQPHQMRRRFNGSLIQTRAKPLTDFLADRCAMEAADLSVSLGSRISHENPIVPENAEGSAYRRAVTRRASRIFPPGPVLCMQGTERSGQTSFEQFTGTSGTASRSALGRTADSLDSTFGAKPGRAITAAPRSVKTAKAAKVLTI
jgi:hypothetical protein